MVTVGQLTCGNSLLCSNTFISVREPCVSHWKDIFSALPSFLWFWHLSKSLSWFSTPLLLHSRVSLDFLVPVSYWLIYLSTLAFRYLWVMLNFSIQTHSLNLWISRAVEWLDNETAVNKACLCRIWYYCFVSRFFLLAWSSLLLLLGFGLFCLSVFLCN